MNQPALSLRQIMNRTYKDVCGFTIPKDDEKNVRKSRGSPVYGEINHQALNYLLEHLKLTRKDVFYDLGSGVGKVVLQTALKTPVQLAVGVELSEIRHRDARDAYKRALTYAPKIKDRVKFINADLMTVRLSQATVIYTCSTAFSLGFMKQLTDHLAKLPNKFRLVSLQDLPETEHFSLQDELRLDMSWARQTPVFIYEHKYLP